MTATKTKRRRPIGSPAWFIAYGKPGFKKANRCRLNSNIICFIPQKHVKLPSSCSQLVNKIVNKVTVCVHGLLKKKKKTVVGTLDQRR